MPAILLLIALLAAVHIETGEACRQKMDLCLAIDGSSTVCGGDEPCENWATVLQFSKNITNTLDIGPGPTFDRVACLTFGNSCKVEWDLRQYTAKNPLLSAIGGLAFEGGVFADLASVNLLVTGIFNPAAGDDTNLPLLPARKNVILFISDGVPIYNDSAAKATSLGIQKYGITYFVICILTGCTEGWAKAVASKPEKANLTTYFLVDSYSSLNNALRETVMDQICYFLEDPPLLPTPPVTIVNLPVG